MSLQQVSPWGRPGTKPRALAAEMPGASNFLSSMGWVAGSRRHASNRRSRTSTVSALTPQVLPWEPSMPGLKALAAKTLGPNVILKTGPADSCRRHANNGKTSTSAVSALTSVWGVMRWPFTKGHTPEKGPSAAASALKHSSGRTTDGFTKGFTRVKSRLSVRHATRPLETGALLYDTRGPTRGKNRWSAACVGECSHGQAS